MPDDFPGLMRVVIPV